MIFGRFLIALLYKFLGIALIIAGVIVGQVLQSVFDVRQITTSNDFINAVLHSENVVTVVEESKQYGALAIMAFGFCFGVLSFGIGVVLGRLRALNRRLDQLSEASE